MPARPPACTDCVHLQCSSAVVLYPWRHWLPCQPHLIPGISWTLFTLAVSLNLHVGDWSLPSTASSQETQGFLLLPKPVLPWEHGEACSSSSVFHAPGAGAITKGWAQWALAGTGPIDAQIFSVPVLSPVSLLRCGGRQCWGRRESVQWGWVILGAGKGGTGWDPKTEWQEKPGHDRSREMALGGSSDPFAGALPPRHSCVSAHLFQLEVRVPGSGSLPVIRRFDLELNMQE